MVWFRLCVIQLTTKDTSTDTSTFLSQCDVRRASEKVHFMNL